MAGLFPCSWSQPLVRRRQPRLLNAGYNLPVPTKPTHLYLPAVIPSDEICPLVDDDREIDQSVQQIQSEVDANYEPEKVLVMTREFNRNLDNTIEKLNTTPREQSVVNCPDLMKLMVAFSHYSHVLERCIKKNQTYK